MEVCQVVEVYNHSIMELEIVFDLNTKLFLIYLQKNVSIWTQDCYIQSYASLHHYVVIN